MIEVREARESDVDQIIKLFVAAYGENYSYPIYYDPQVLKKMVFDEDTLLIVAEDTANENILGTASVIYDLGAYGDLAGEFGRLVVHPEGRKRGIGKKLMEERLKRASKRLHVGFVENRVAHPFSQRISSRYDFAPAGFLPLKACFEKRESLALYLRLFSDALTLRRNNPRVIPEGFQLAQFVLASCGIDPDVIVDETAPAYPNQHSFEIERMRTKGYASLLRFARAKSGSKEIFGPAKIHHGMFRLRSKDSDYVIARKNGQLVGAIGYSIDQVEKAVKIFEIVTVDAGPTKMLIEEVISRCRNEYDMAYIEADVSAYSPRMQQTMLELDFTPVAYLPAFAFKGAERCDAIRMASVYVPVLEEKPVLYEATRPVYDIVMRNFSTKQLIPRLAEALPSVALFRGLTSEQTRRLAEIFSLKNLAEGETLVTQGQHSESAIVLLKGELSVMAGNSEEGRTVGTVGAGDCFGETALLNREPHSVSARAKTDIEAATIASAEFQDLLRRRPDIGVIIYRNLAKGLGKKLRDLNAEVAQTG